MSDFLKSKLKALFFKGSRFGISKTKEFFDKATENLTKTAGDDSATEILALDTLEPSDRPTGSSTTKIATPVSAELARVQASALARASKDQESREAIHHTAKKAIRKTELGQPSTKVESPPLSATQDMSESLLPNPAPQKPSITGKVSLSAGWDENQPPVIMADDNARLVAEAGSSAGKTALAYARLGADQNGLDHNRKRLADAPISEGHRFAARLLSPLVDYSQEHEKAAPHDEIPKGHSVTDTIEASSEKPATAVQRTESDDRSGDLDDLLWFEAEEEPEEFFAQSSSETASGTFVALVGSPPTVSENEVDWELDLSSGRIAGEGIRSGITITADQGAEHEFLKVRNRGRKSVKRATIQTGTRLSINPEICITWAEETLRKGWFSTEDIDALIAHCEGNGDPEELRINLRRNLEAAGLDLLDQASGHGAVKWDARSDIMPDELAEAIEAVLTRATRLPGTQRFIMNKSDELRLLEPMVRAKQELQLSILACEAAVETILDVMDRIGDGSRDPESVSLRSIIPTRPGHAETAEVFAARDALKFWHANGRAMDGKQRREALAALEALDLSLAFHKEMAGSLEGKQASLEDANRLQARISISEAATEALIRMHLPYARRFAARNVEEGEDPEDVFQVAFMGLQRATRRFDPDRGIRFVVYCTFWMQQSLKRWRADEGSSIRVPVHRHENLAKLDRAMNRLDVRANGTVSDDDLALELDWSTEEVHQFRGIPREAYYPDSTEAWECVLPEPENTNIFSQAETEKIVSDALAELQDRQADIIRMRFGIGRDAEMTLEEIGKFYGVTRERIRQIEAKGLDHLSHPSRKRRIQTLLGM
jgi:RNA polymerase primary sigma factor